MKKKKTEKEKGLKLDKQSKFHPHRSKTVQEEEIGQGVAGGRGWR